ncbi:MAG TPA: DNA polymerase III subunit gamma/tau, partial [Polyangiaceae bacterium]|nr:DNA polymerase III subunit gamma/tau [Polyangiaceae bacterium]
MGADTAQTTQNDTDRVAYQSLYRRFRPQRFDEVLGQPQVSLALRNVVREGRVGHAYLFSGPRGTGKTSTARILAKALNCAAPEEGEPCGRCESCIEIANGSSLDVHELDAASNNGVDAMRDLVSRAALGTPGRWKVYIVDEVHMLSAAASNALLKTLEEPPGHVVFVLATTEAQKVLPTIRSRTQHFEFRLLSSEILSGLLRHVRESADLGVEDDALDAAVRRGRGSARDALSALDQLSAGGVVGDDFEVLAELSDALADRDAGRAMTAVARACEGGRDATRVAAELADYLRQGFLAAVAAELVSVSGAEREHVEDVARRMGLPALVRCLEELGRAQVDMRDIPDPRVHFEVTLIRLSHPEADDSPAAILERLDRVERALAERGTDPGAPSSPRTVDVPAAPTGGVPPTRASRAPGAGSASDAQDSTGRGTRMKPDSTARAPAEDTTSSMRSARAQASDVGQPADEPEAPEATEATTGAGGPGLARQTLGAIRRATAAPARTSSAASAPPTPPPSASTSGVAPTTPPAPETGASPVSSVSTSVAGGPTRDELVQVWGDGLLASLPNRARARFRVGRFLATDGGAAVFALPSETHRRY